VSLKDVQFGAGPSISYVKEDTPEVEAVRTSQPVAPSISIVATDDENRVPGIEDVRTSPEVAPSIGQVVTDDTVLAPEIRRINTEDDD
jgi:hypothetical protein